MRKKLREYRIELTALFFLILGISLIFEQFDIRRNVKIFFSNLAVASLAFVNHILQGLVSYFRGFTISDLLGFAFILFAGAFIVWRTRARFLSSARWLVKNCPRCGNPVHRVHRTAFDRLLGGTILPDSRRYRCANPKCAWTGLRHYDHHRLHHMHEEEPGTVPGTPEL